MHLPQCSWSGEHIFVFIAFFVLYLYNNFGWLLLQTFLIYFHLFANLTLNIMQPIKRTKYMLRRAIIIKYCIVPNWVQQSYFQAAASCTTAPKKFFYRNFNVHLIKRFVLFEILLQNLIVWVYFWHLVGVYVYGKSRDEFNRRIYQILDFKITKVIDFFSIFILSRFWSFASFKFILKCGEIARKT